MSSKLEQQPSANGDEPRKRVSSTGAAAAPDSASAAKVAVEKRVKKKPLPQIRINLAACKYPIRTWVLRGSRQQRCLAATAGSLHVADDQCAEQRRDPLLPAIECVRMMPWLSTVRTVQEKLGWREVGDDEDFEVYWTDTSVAIERIMKLSPTQVYP